MDAVALAPDGASVATGASDGSIRVWDAQGKAVHEMQFPGQPVVGLAFLTPTHLGVVLGDGDLRVVTLDTNELLQVSRQSLTRTFTQDECDRMDRAVPDARGHAQRRRRSALEVLLAAR